MYYNIVPTIQVKTFPKQKPWINSRYDTCCTNYGLRTAIAAVKKQFREKLDNVYSPAKRVKNVCLKRRGSELQNNSNV